MAEERRGANNRRLKRENKGLGVHRRDFWGGGFDDADGGSGVGVTGARGGVRNGNENRRGEIGDRERRRNVEWSGTY